MKNNTWIPVTLGVVALGAVGFFLYKKFAGKGAQKIEDIKKQGEEVKITTTDAPVPPPITTGNPLFDIGNVVGNFLKQYQDYTVQTQTSNLNVREKPDATSKIVGQFKKGQTIRAKVSGTKGWHAVSENDKDIKGYVSSGYIKLKSK
jgi:hypothetical protein